MSRNKNLFKLFLTVGALSTACFFLNASATDAGTAVESAGTDVDLSKLDVQSLKDANLNNSEATPTAPLNEEVYDEYLKTDYFKKFRWYNIPIEFEGYDYGTVLSGAEALAVKTVIAYLGSWLVDKIKLNPYINKFLATEERWPGSNPKMPVNTIEKSLKSFFGSGGTFKGWVYNRKTQNGKYVGTYAQRLDKDSFGLSTNGIIANAMGIVLNNLKQNNQEGLKQILSSVTPDDVVEYAKQCVDKRLKRDEDWKKYNSSMSLDDYKEEAIENSKYIIKAVKKRLNGELKDVKAYRESLEKAKKDAEGWSAAHDDKDWKEVRLKYLGAMKACAEKMLNSADVKNADEIKEDLECINAEIAEMQELKNKDKNGGSGRDKYIESLNAKLNDSKALEEGYKEELANAKKTIEDNEKILNDSGELEKIAQDSMKNQKEWAEKHAAYEAADIKALEAQKDDLNSDAVKNSIAEMLKRIRITDEGFETKDTEGYVPGFLGEEE